ncbi:MAG: type II toxin-antitoxin system VapC family toxin [Pseudonocardiales bacterium]|nr:type II toxin-antitoxin system VapC family toxin [Pseudonocardiales bacterium]
MDFVIDTSAIVELFAGAAVVDELRRVALTARGAAPELLDLEAAQAIRGMVRRGDLTDAEGSARLRQVQQSPITRVSHRQLVDRVWELRHSVTAYDAAYIALAERLDAPLLTCDRRLAGAHGHRAHVELYARS